MKLLKNMHRSEPIMSACAIRIGALDETHEVNVLTGGSYPFISIVKDDEEVGVVDIVPGYNVYRYTVMPAFRAAGVEVEATVIEIITHIGGSYEYVQVLDPDGEELLCHDLERSVGIGLVK